MESSILSAIIAAIVSVLVSIISLYGTRATERKKLTNAIKQQEIQNRLNALHTGVQVIQKLKNELRHLIDKLNTSTNVDTTSIKQQADETRNLINQLEESFEDAHSIGLSSLSKDEGSMLHDMLSQFGRIKGEVQLVSHYSNDKEKLKSVIESLQHQRNNLSTFQDQYKSLRNKIVRSEKL
jgi:hypothetical protein